MHNCHDDMLKYHNHKVTLPRPEQNEMRARRDTNRDRLRSGLERDGQPSPKGFQSQGSYAHHTMVQNPNKDYDIDDGVYFDIEDLKGPRGGDKTPYDAKDLVRAGLHDDRFSDPPEVRTNCVRIHYNEGYHMDVPVYREVVEENELGNAEIYWEIASSEWKRSDPKGVTTWFREENSSQSPDTENGRQLRRVVRLIKAFARSREGWRDHIASGFMISVLVVECYQRNESREDQALFDTMVAIHNRLRRNLEIAHPVVEGDKLTKGPNDAKVRFLLERLRWALAKLDVLSQSSCTRKQALEAWDGVFHTKFFTDQLSDDGKTAKAAGSGQRASVIAPTIIVPSKTNQPPATNVNLPHQPSKPWRP